MTSIRYLCFALYYLLINSYIISLNEITLESIIGLFISTLIFFYIIKYFDNKKNEETKSILLISVFYGGLSLSFKYIYYIFTNIDSIKTFLPFINSTYIPEALFISGWLLLINHIMSI